MTFGIDALKKFRHSPVVLLRMTAQVRQHGVHQMSPGVRHIVAGQDFSRRWRPQLDVKMPPTLVNYPARKQICALMNRQSNRSGRHSEPPILVHRHFHSLVRQHINGHQQRVSCGKNFDCLPQLIFHVQCSRYLRKRRKAVLHTLHARAPGRSPFYQRRRRKTRGSKPESQKGSKEPKMTKSQKSTGRFSRRATSRYSMPEMRARSRHFCRRKPVREKTQD